MPAKTSDAAFAAIQGEQSARLLEVTSDEAGERLHEHIRGSTALITGVTPGSLGADAARVIARHQPKLLVLANRSEGPLMETIATIKAAHPGVDIKPLVVDLGSQQSVRSAASDLLSLAPVLDVLINSAAVMMIADYTTTPEGIEAHFGINHIGHFLLTNLIMPALLASPAPRVVNISAAAHRSSPVRFDDYNFGSGREYDPFLGYAQSKCANLLFTISLAEKLGKSGLTSLGVDPGGSITNLFYRAPDMMKKHGWADENGEPSALLKASIKTVPQAAANYIVAAYDPDLKDCNGSVIRVCEVDHTTPDHAKDSILAKRLWKLSENIVGQAFTYQD